MSRTTVFAAVVTRDELVLICQRPQHKRHGGLWEFPGGKVEPGETSFEAVSREMAEELGVKVWRTGPPLMAVDDPGSESLIEFVPTEIEGAPMCLEHVALCWVAIEDLLRFDLAPSDRRFAEFLLADIARTD